MTRTIQANIELFLADYIRREIRQPDLLAAYPLLVGFEVSNREPEVDAKDFPAKLIVVRDDGTTPTDIITGSTSVGISVLMGDPKREKDASLAARIVHSIVRDSARVEPGNPVAAIFESNGPYSVPEEQPRVRFYSTHELGTVETDLAIPASVLGSETVYVPVYDVDIPDLTLQFENGLT